jgi:uncharacterized protein with HEPN domain
LRRDLLCVQDAILHSERVLLFVADYDLAKLPEDPMRLDAVLRNLQIIGEAVKQIPEELRQMQPQIPWSKIAGIRNRLVHHYFVVDTEVISDICRNHLHPLLAALKVIASSAPNDPN